MLGTKKTSFKLVLIFLTSLLLLGGAVFLRKVALFLPHSAHNMGIAFGLWSSQPLILLVLPTILLLLLYLTLKSPSYFLGFFFLTSGGIANFLERLIFGNVFDYLYLPPLPSFNVADLFVALGVLLLLINFIYGARKGSA